MLVGPFGSTGVAPSLCNLALFVSIIMRRSAEMIGACKLAAVMLLNFRVCHRNSRQRGVTAVLIGSCLSVDTLFHNLG